MTVPKKGKDRRQARAQVKQLERFKKQTPAIGAAATEDKDQDKVRRCSFCGKSQNEVKKLIGAPKACICNECIDICNEIIADDQQAASQD
jgi:hypothetical protein